LEYLFLKLFSFQEEDGQVVRIKEYEDTEFWKKLYFRSFEEMNFYINYLHKIGLIDANLIDLNEYDNPILENYYVTFSGLRKAIELQEDGKNSDKCFIAMAFKPETQKIRDAIKSALRETGFQPII